MSESTLITTSTPTPSPPPPPTSKPLVPLPSSVPEFLSSYDPLPLSGLPFITLTYATSLDSSLSLSPGVQTVLSGPLSKSLTHYLRTKHTAILIGANTAIADDPGLNSRLPNTPLEKQPIPVILDPHFRWKITRNSRVLREAREGRGKPPMVVVTPESYRLGDPRIQWIFEAGGQVVVLDYEHEQKPVPAPTEKKGTGEKKLVWGWEYLLRSLKSYDLDSIMIEGGGCVINNLLQQENLRFVNSVIVTVAPVYLGQGGVQVCPKRVEEDGKPINAVKFVDVNWLPLGRDVVMAARVG